MFTEKGEKSGEAKFFISMGMERFWVNSPRVRTWEMDLVCV